MNLVGEERGRIYIMLLYHDEWGDHLRYWEIIGRRLDHGFVRVCMCPLLVQWNVMKAWVCELT